MQVPNVSVVTYLLTIPFVCMAVGVILLVMIGGVSIFSWPALLLCIGIGLLSSIPSNGLMTATDGRTSNHHRK